MWSNGSLNNRDNVVWIVSNFPVYILEWNFKKQFIFYKSNANGFYGDVFSTIYNEKLFKYISEKQNVGDINNEQFCFEDSVNTRYYRKVRTKYEMYIMYIHR